jgi:hypothetical protein
VNDTLLLDEPLSGEEERLIRDTMRPQAQERRMLRIPPGIASRLFIPR